MSTAYVLGEGGPPRLSSGEDETVGTRDHHVSMPVDLLIEFDSIQATLEAVTDFRSLHRWSYAVAPLVAAIVASALGWPRRVTAALAVFTAGLVVWSGYAHMQDSFDQVPVAREAAQAENASLLAEHFAVAVDPGRTACLQTLIDMPTARCTIPSAAGDATYVFTVTDGRLNLESVGPAPITP